MAAEVEEGRSKRLRKSADGYKYLKSNKGLLLDFFVLLPVMQVRVCLLIIIIFYLTDHNLS